ncbi:MAG: PAS domain-containing protein [Candidatus Latescibacteria bacterium]|nr:PAS domain-containing protein [Candidatus Latescibacterota bacterium]
MRLAYRLGLVNALLVLAVLALVQARSQIDAVVVVCALLLVGATVWGAVRWLDRPLGRLIRETRRLADGDLRGDVGAGTGAAELRHLAAALEQARGAIQGQIEGGARDAARLESILNSLPEGILVVDREGKVALANRGLQQLFNFAAPLGGRGWVEGIRSTAVEEAFAKVFATGADQRCQLELPGQEKRHLEVRLAPILQGGECTGSVAVFYEITRLVQLERARRDFVANVSHELRTPLTAIKGCAETLSDGALDDHEATVRFVQIILGQSDRLNLLIDDLLDLARLESEQLEVHQDRCSLLHLAQAGATAVSQAAAGKNIAVGVEVPAELTVRCDPRLIEQTIINLLDNAVKYTPEGGQVVVRGRLHGALQKAVLEVSDTGIGIPPADQERLFERFYRVDKGRSRAMGGTGLGLSIVRNVLEVHGEKPFVRSQLGKGSTFGFTLPLDE